MKQLSRTGSLSCILTTKEQMLLTGTCVWTVRSSLVCRLFRAGLAKRALRAIYCRREEVPVSPTRERLPQSRSCVPLIKELNPRSQVGTPVKESFIWQMFLIKPRVSKKKKNQFLKS